jgi:electron transport complex protein RnfA
MSSLLVILIGTALVNTFLLMHEDESLGGDRQSGSIANAIRIAGATLITLVCAVALTHIAWSLFAIDESLADALLLLYSALVVGIAIALHRFTNDRLPRLRRALTTAPILIVGNCLGLGTLLLGIMATASIAQVLIAVASLGLGFVLLLVSFVALVARVTEREVPTPFQLAPITLISAGLTALALMGFTGLFRV